MVFKSETPKSHVLGWKGPAKKVRRCVIVLPSWQKSTVRHRDQNDLQIQIRQAVRDPFGLSRQNNGARAKATKHWSDTRQVRR